MRLLRDETGLTEQWPNVTHHASNLRAKHAKHDVKHRAA
jgi:hypothetical protein